MPLPSRAMTATANSRNGRATRVSVSRRAHSGRRGRGGPRGIPGTAPTTRAVRATSSEPRTLTREPSSSRLERVAAEVVGAQPVGGGGVGERADAGGEGVLRGRAAGRGPRGRAITARTATAMRPEVRASTRRITVTLPLRGRRDAGQDQVDEQVEGDDQDDRHHEDALDGGYVAGLGGVVGEPAEAPAGRRSTR